MSSVSYVKKGITKMPSTVSDLKKAIEAKFISKYGAKPDLVITNAHTQQLRMGNLKELSPKDYKKYIELEKAIIEAHEALAMLNKISLGIK